MSFLNKLERRFGGLAVPSIAKYLVIAQVAVYALVLLGQVSFGSLVLVPSAVLQGEIWRLVTFVICPPEIATTPVSMIFLAFQWYVFFMIGNTLEQEWGVFRLNCYLYLGMLFAIIGAFVGHLISPVPEVFILPSYLYWTAFFAFATLYPNIQFLLLVIPVKVKWLAWFLLAYIGYILMIVPTMGYRVAICFPFLNYVLFFHKSVLQSVQAKQRRKKFAAENRVRDSEAFHVCAICGATDKTHPERNFRYKEIDGEQVAVCNVCRDEGH